MNSPVLGIVVAILLRSTFLFLLLADMADNFYRHDQLTIINIFMMDLCMLALYVYDIYGTAISEEANDD